MRKTSSFHLLYRVLYRANGLAVLLFFFLPLAQAQPVTPSTSQDVVRSVLPNFQTGDGLAGKSTEIVVSIIIGKKGRVAQAEAVIDKSTLGKSCVLAARKWIFIPEIAAGTTGVLKFSFTPDGKVSATVSLSPKFDPEDPVPKPLFQTSEGEAKWWEDLRMAGREVVVAHKQKADALKKVDERVNEEIDRETVGLFGIKDRNVVGDAVHKKFQPEIDAVHAEHNPRVVMAEDRFRALLREGDQKSVIGPLTIHRPIFVHMVKAKYAEEARQNKIEGKVILKIEFRADGTVDVIQVLRGMPDGLTETSIEAAKQTVFIPISKNGKFVSSRASLEYAFSLY